ncbi:MAG: hypothetical protein H9535_19765 [Ignavibacteria bacterium]|nr:hypothetical protein [Ignavibacteria bacterium]
MPVKLIEFLQQLASATTARIAAVLAALVTAGKSTAGIFGYDVTQNRFVGVRTNGGAPEPFAHLSDITPNSVKAFSGALGPVAANETTVTHNLGTTKINSVTLVNTDNYPIVAGWEVIDNNNLKIYTLSDYADLPFSIVALP